MLVCNPQTHCFESLKHLSTSPHLWPTLCSQSAHLTPIQFFLDHSYHQPMPHPTYPQKSSHTKEDSEESEMENIMGHHSVRERHLFASCEGEGHESPHTEETSTFLRLPALCRTLGEVEPDPKHNIQTGYVDLPPPFSPSPISPSRPKSPWGRFDPYDSTEVMLGDLV